MNLVAVSISTGKVLEIQKYNSSINRDRQKIIDIICSNLLSSGISLKQYDILEMADVELFAKISP